MRLSPTVVRCLSLLVLSLPAVARSQSGYHVSRRIATGGEGGWDYLAIDSVNHRLYVSRGTHVQVIDTNADTLVADIANTPGVHGIAFAPRLGRGYTSNGRDSSVTVFDLTTAQPLMVVRHTGANPDAIAFDDASGRVFTFNGSGQSTTAIDAATGAIVGSLPLGGKPESAQSDAGTMYVNIESQNAVTAFDTKTLAVTGHIPLPGCDEPTGMGIDRVTHRLFIGCSGNATMAIVDYARQRVLATVRVGEGVDANEFDAGTGLSFASAGDGTLSVIREDAPGHFAVETVQTVRGARTMALDPRTHRIYLSSARYGAMPGATPERPRPRPPIVPGSFTVLIVER